MRDDTLTRKKADGEPPEPESVRTPGRTWSSYPDLERSGEEPGLEIRKEGDVTVQHDEKPLEIIEPGENSYTAHHFRNIDRVIRVTGEGRVELIWTAEAPASIHLIVETGESRELRVSQQFRGDAETFTSVSEFRLSDNSTVSYTEEDHMDSDTLYTRKKYVLGQDSSLELLEASLGAKRRISRSNIELEGENASADLESLWFADSDEISDLRVEVTHSAENTRCEMETRGVADGSARTVYEGRQKVEENAPGTSSFQKEDSLILSEDAEVFASPKLMIENNEVEASHSATAGRVPGEEMHYLRSRGIEEKRARKMLVEAFFEPLLEGDNENLERIREKIGDRLG